MRHSRKRISRRRPKSKSRRRSKKTRTSRKKQYRAGRSRASTSRIRGRYSPYDRPQAGSTGEDMMIELEMAQLYVWAEAQRRESERESERERERERDILAEQAIISHSRAAVPLPLRHLASSAIPPRNAHNIAVRLLQRQLAHRHAALPRQHVPASVREWWRTGAPSHVQCPYCMPGCGKPYGHGGHHKLKGKGNFYDVPIAVQQWWNSMNPSERTRAIDADLKRTVDAAHATAIRTHFPHPDTECQSCRPGSGKVSGHTGSCLGSTWGQSAYVFVPGR